MIQRGYLLSLLLALALLLTVPAGCASNSSRSAATVARRLGREDEVRVAAFRALLRPVSGPTRDSQIIFLSADATGPDADVSGRVTANLIDLGFNFQPVSRSTGSHSDQVRESTTGNPGIIFKAGPVHWPGPDSAELPVGTYAGGTDATGGTMRVAFKGGKWVVTEQKIQAMK